MTQFAGKTNPTLNADVQAQQFIKGTYDITVDGATDGTLKSIGCLPAGALLDPTGMFCLITTAFDGTTPLLDVYLVPRTTETIDTTATFPTAAITEGTTGYYYNTAANVKTAGYLDKLATSYEVLVKASLGGSNTVGKATFVIPFFPDLDPTLWVN